jgi:DNA polymerase III sliding clamp (beta) subunit (PCNA family)
LGPERDKEGMKITVSTKHLSNILELIKDSGSTALPILNDCVIEVHHEMSGGSRVLHTNLERSFAIKLNAEIEEEGVALVNIKRLLLITKNSTEENIRISTSKDNSKLEIRSGKSKSTCPISFGVEDYPTIEVGEHLDENAWHTIEAGELMPIMLVSHSVTKKDDAFNQRTICISQSDDELTVHATDGHRASKIELESNNIKELIAGRCSTFHVDMFRIIEMHNREHQLQLAFMVRPENNACLLIARSQAMAMSMSCSLENNNESQADVSGFIENVIPTGTVTLKVKDLLPALKRSSSTSNSTVFDIVNRDDGTKALSISCRDQAGNEYEEEVSASIDCDDVKLGLNCQYMIEAIEQFNEVVMHIENYHSGILFKPIDAKHNYVELIMPIIL